MGQGNKLADGYISTIKSVAGGAWKTCGRNCLLDTAAFYKNLVIANCRIDGSAEDNLYKRHDGKLAMGTNPDPNASNTRIILHPLQETSIPKLLIS